VDDRRLHGVGQILPGVVVGATRGPFVGSLTGDLLRRYAATTLDPSPAVRAGTVVPPVALVTQIWDAQNEGRAAAVPDELQQAAVGGVHGEHDIVLHRPIRPDEPLRTFVEGHGSRPAGRSSLVTLRYATFDGDDHLVAEQWWTTVYLGVTCEVTGDGARERPAGTCSIDVDPDMARRYAEVSGDWSDHHFTAEAAQRSGFDRPFLHGLCTMALCAQGVVDVVAAGDHSRVRRIAVRFASPTFIGERVDVHVFDAGEVGWAFEAESNGATVVSNGRVELR
jgi:acyl dehydratase